MARSFATVCFLLVAHPGWAGMARAPDPVIGVDGCAVLAAVVYTEVTEARHGSPAGYGSNLLFAGRDEFALCHQTTLSVTGAYSAALRQVNIHVVWGYHTGYRGDYCLSYFLSQCYPAGDPAMPPLSDDERSFVAYSWQAVRNTVYDRMVLNPGSDVARFRRDALRRSIRRSMHLDRFEDRPRALQQ
jgi:hypothetical protein